MIYQYIHRRSQSQSGQIDQSIKNPKTIRITGLAAQNKVRGRDHERTRLCDGVEKRYNSRVLKKSPLSTFFAKYTAFLVPALLLVFYFITHLPRLVALPVFADEAIYIRWAQLIMDDWQRYLFFPMNDGKTPLFIWLLIPFQYLFSDQLWAARFVSVLVGAAQLLVIQQIAKMLGARPKTQWLTMLLVAVLPFWYFHHRMALMDSMLVLFLSLTVWGELHILLRKKRKWLWVVLTGIFFGLSFWTKLPALFLIPIFGIFLFLPEKKRWQEYIPYLFPLAVAGFIGCAMFAALRISPSFSQLFRRGADFTYPISDVLLHGMWQQTLRNIPTYISYFAQYFTVPMLLLAFAGLFSKRSRRLVMCLLLAAACFSGPFILFGRVIYARYLFPSALFLTLATTLSTQALYDHWFVEQVAPSQLWKKTIIGIALALLFANTIAFSFSWMWSNMFDINHIPFTTSDRAQYLEDWSAGQGITETVQYIQSQAQSHSIAVATEGRFGTLPDGLLLYFHNRDVQDIYIEGTGEYPVKSLPDFFVQRAKDFDQSILIVNSNRMELHLPDNKKIAEYCRTNNAPCLQVWNITQIVKK